MLYLYRVVYLMILPFPRKLRRAKKEMAGLRRSKGLKRSSSPSEEKGREESSLALDETTPSSSGLRFARACWRLETRPEGRKLFFQRRSCHFQSEKRKKGSGI